MIGGLKPYPEYKDSGLPWLGKIPAHWDVRRMKRLLREVDFRSVTGKEQLLRVSQYSGVTQRKSIEGSDVADTRASSLVGYKRVAERDLGLASRAVVHVRAVRRDLDDDVPAHAPDRQLHRRAVRRVPHDVAGEVGQHLAQGVEPGRGARALAR